MNESLEIEVYIQEVSELFDEVHFQLAEMLEPDCSIHNELDAIIGEQVSISPTQLFRWAENHIEQCDQQLQQWGTISSITSAFQEVQRIYYRNKLEDQLSKVVLYALLTHKKEEESQLEEEDFYTMRDEVDKMLYKDEIWWL